MLSQKILLACGAGAISAAVLVGQLGVQDRLGQTYLQTFCTKFPSSKIPADVESKLSAPLRRRVRDVSGRTWDAASQRLVEINPQGGKRVIEGRDRSPIVVSKGVAAGPDGRLWIVNDEGLVMLAPDAPREDRWRYFLGERYLASKDVLGVAPEAGRAWVQTSRGTSLLEFRPYTLEQKAGDFLRRLRARHLRYGFVNDCALTHPGDVSSCKLMPSDNDGLWTALYAAAECFRYGATHAPDALENARESLSALERLQSITGIPGFPARAICRRGEARDAGGEWHWTSDGAWEWKGDTSSDELVGHFFAYAVAYDLLPDAEIRAGVSGAAGRIATHLLDHGFRLVGSDGRATRWGDYSPEYFRTSEGHEEAPLSSLEILSNFRVAYRLTGDPRFLSGYRHLAFDFGYAKNVERFRTELPAEINYSDEELAFLAFYSLVKLEDDPALKATYLAALEGFWRRTRDEKNPLWDYIYGAVSASPDYDRRGAIETLERIPMDTVTWTVKNSGRRDLEARTVRGRFGEKQAWRAIRPDERAVMKWNGNPFELDGGDGGRHEDDGTFFLLPYWLGRFANL